MEVRQIQKNIHTTPRKLRLVADMVRNMSPERALQMLSVTNKAAALPLAKAVKTALSNARMQSLDVSKMQFKTLEVNEDLAMKRIRAGTKGRAKPYKKRTSQVRVILTDEAKVKNQESRKEKTLKSTSKEEPSH